MTMLVDDSNKIFPVAWANLLFCVIANIIILDINTTGKAENIPTRNGPEYLEINNTIATTLPANIPRKHNWNIVYRFFDFSDEGIFKTRSRIQKVAIVTRKYTAEFIHKFLHSM